MPASDYASIYQDAGNTFNVDPLLGQAVGQVESAGKPDAVSRDEQGRPIAHGVMQLTAPNLQRLNVRDPYKPENNIPAGMRMLDEALTTSGGDVGQALRIYHGGTDTSKWGPETLSYPSKVASQLQKLQAAQAQSKQPTATQPAPADDDDAFLSGHPSHPANVPSAPPTTLTSSPSAATQAASQQPDEIDSFLTGKSAQPVTPQPGTPGEPSSPNTAGSSAQPYIATGADIMPPINTTGAVGRIAQGAVQGAKQGFDTGMFQEEPGLRSSEAQMLQTGSPLARIEAGAGLAGSYVNRGLGAISGAVTGAITQAGEELPTTIGGIQVQGPQLARDITAMPEAFSGMQGALGVRVPENVRNPLSMPVTKENGLLVYRPTPNALSDASAAPLSREFRTNPGVTEPSIPSGPTTPNPLRGYPGQDMPANPLSSPTKPATATGAPADTAATPKSAGAGASTATQAAMSAKDAQAYRSVGEFNKLNEPQPVGKDLNRYIPGVEPTAAEMEQSANTSREQKMLESAIPEEFKTAAKVNNEARSQYVEGLAPSEVQIKNMTDDREAQRAEDTEAAWKTKSPADPSPITDQIQQVLNGPDGKIRSVKNAMNQLMDGLKNSDGTLETDPQRLYGIRRDLANDYSKAAVGQDATKAAGASALANLLPTVDSVIEKAAPGYRNYMDNYSANSSAIDGAQVLRDRVNKLYDTSGRIQLNKVQSFMRDAVQSRAAQGLNPYKSIPDETMSKLWALRDDLRRSASADELARAKGSDTAQNMMDLAKQGAKVGGKMALHGAANAVAPFSGSLMLNAGESAINALSSKRAQRKMQQRAGNMLRPDPTQYPPPNPLSP